MDALLFDCDGVLVDTERDGHRVAFNEAFAAKGLDVCWGVQEYKKLVKVAGGKERMHHYFDQNGWPERTSSKDEFVKELHTLKTQRFMQLIETGALPLRPGIARLVDEAISDGIKLAVCSTSNEQAVTRIVEVLLGEHRKKHFSIFAGDVVANKKPDPAIYKLCAWNMALKPAQCVVVEDSRNGLLAAKAAGFHCIITTNDYSAEEDFSEADAVVPELGDNPVLIHLHTLKEMIAAKV
jgi:HAD superfamily hydrolase (TIGR01509 family)